MKFRFRATVRGLSRVGLIDVDLKSLVDNVGHQLLDRPLGDDGSIVLGQSVCA